MSLFYYETFHVNEINWLLTRAVITSFGTAELSHAISNMLFVTIAHVIRIISGNTF